MQPGNAIAFDRMMTNPADDSTSPPGPAAKSRRGCVWFAGGLLLGLAAALVGLIAVSRATGLPRLTREAYEKADRLWDAGKVANYNLEVDVTGNRPSRIHVEVRDGQATHCFRDGVEPSQRRTWYYWTVPGMFDTIGLELEKVDDPATGFGAAAGSSVVLRAEFDEQLGYPRRYSRTVASQNLDMGWTITRFEVVSDGDGAEGPH
jgi:Family of unknown function (DUF6174)